MKKVACYSLLVLLAICALPSTAAAVSCPADPNPGDNVYTLNGTPPTTVVDCVFEYADDDAPGGGNLQGGANDDFLDGPNGDGTNPYFGGGWTSFCSTSDATPPSGSGDCDNIYGFTFSSTAGTSGNWSFTGVATEEYALGIKDGADPHWAVFLLSHTDTTGSVFYSGTWGIQNGSLSHFAIYDRADGGGTDSQDPIPEPGSLLLLGSGLTFVANRFRKRKKN